MNDPVGVNAKKVGVKSGMVNLRKRYAVRDNGVAELFISIANNVSRRDSGIKSDNHEPTGAPIIPATANIKPVATSTCPAFQRPKNPTREVTPTAASEIPTACRGSIDKP